MTRDNAHMNFLGHLWLADRTGTSLAGSILGDVVRGADLSAYPPPIALGIRLHRRVDAITDRHPAMRNAKGSFDKATRRYAGIVLDMAADHALTQVWSQWHVESLEHFADRCGEAIEASGPWFEKGGGVRLRAAAFSALLQSYAHDRGMERAYQRTSTRLRNPDQLIDASRDWLEHAKRLEPQLESLLSAQLSAMQALMQSGSAVSTDG